MTWLPYPGSAPAVQVLAAPAAGPGNWSGAPSAVLDDDGTVILALRIRESERRGGTLVLTRWTETSGLTTIATWDRGDFGAESLERPAIVRRPDGWQLYVSCATPGSKHWRIDVLEASDLSGLGRAPHLTVFAGSAELAVKDPVIAHRDGRLLAWICCHPLEVAGAEDRMHTRLAESVDGRSWSWLGTVLSGRPGRWDARGARVTAVIDDGRAYYDGRATAEENFSERTGIAGPGTGSGLVAVGAEPVADVRYVAALPESGGLRLFYESPQGDGSHDLRTEWAPRQPLIQSA